MTKRQAIFFLIDTQGANCVGCYRPDLALQTPNIDRLAERGVRFERAYTCTPVCGPARSALLTGLFPHSNGVLANDMAPHLDLPTLGQRLSTAGIATGYIGKWHLDGSDYFGDGRCPPDGKRNPGSMVATISTHCPMTRPDVFHENHSVPRNSPRMGSPLNSRMLIARPIARWILSAVTETKIFSSLFRSTSRIIRGFVPNPSRATLKIFGFRSQTRAIR